MSITKEEIDRLPDPGLKNIHLFEGEGFEWGECYPFWKNLQGGFKEHKQLNWTNLYLLKKFGPIVKEELPSGSPHGNKFCIDIPTDRNLEAKLDQINERLCSIEERLKKIEGLELQILETKEMLKKIDFHFNM